MKERCRPTERDLFTIDEAASYMRMPSFLNRLLWRQPMAELAVTPREVVNLGWLADAPLFIDTEQVAAFYDAVVRPEAEQKKITLSLKSLETEKTTLGGELKATISVAKWLTTIFPFLDASVEGKVQGAVESQQGKEETRTIELQSISSPQRQLVQLTLHYILQLPTRIRIVSDPTDPRWYDPTFIQELPRALVFLDFPPNSAFIPMAAELDEGKVVLIYDEAARAFTGGKENPNPRPNERGLPPEQLQEAWLKYWKWYAENFDSYGAMGRCRKSRRRWGTHPLD
jgi:hypothetical protein